MISTCCKSRRKSYRTTFGGTLVVFWDEMKSGQFLSVLADLRASGRAVSSGEVNFSGLFMTQTGDGTPPREPFYGRAAGDRLIHKGDRVDLVLRTVRTNSGKVQVREVCLHRGAVIILPVLGDGRIVLIRNRRHTVFDTLLELPAGTLEYAAETGEPGDATEDPSGAAARELTEETGYTAGNILPFGWFYTSPGILTEKMYAFVATDLSPGRQDLEDNEQIQVELATKEQILHLIEENRIVDAKTIATLLKYFAAKRADGC